MRHRLVQPGAGEGVQVLDVGVRADEDPEGPRRAEAREGRIDLIGEALGEGHLRDRLPEALQLRQQGSLDVVGGQTLRL